PGTHKSKRTREDAREFEQRFRARVLGELELARTEVDDPSYVHVVLDGQPHLFSCVRRYFRGRSYYVVVEHDLIHLVAVVFPQFFAVHPRTLYQVVDESGDIVFGVPWTGVAESDVVEVPFRVTLRQ